MASEEGRVRTAGLCNGGPMDGRIGESRYPTGFVLVDKPGGRAWIYDWIASGGVAGPHFQCREPVGRELDRDGAIRAAAGFDYDVRALDVA